MTKLHGELTDLEKVKLAALPEATSALLLAVNPSSGTDTPSAARPRFLSGGDYTAAPFATVQAALDSMPRSIGAFDHRITVTASTSAGFSVHSFTGPGSVDVVGTQSLATLASGPNTGTVGAGSTSTIINKPAGADWTVGDVRGQVLVITGGGGFYPDTADNVAIFGPCQRVIRDNTINTLSIYDLPGIDNTTTFSIVEPATLINACAQTYSGLSFCVGVLGNDARVLVRNILPNDNTQSTFLLADHSHLASFYGWRFPATPSLVWSISNMAVTFSHNYVAGTYGSDGFFTDLSKLFCEGLVIDDSTQMRASHIQDALIIADGLNGGKAMLDARDCTKLSLGITANGFTVPPLEMTGIVLCEISALVGANPAASAAVLIEGGGQYKLNGATITGIVDVLFENVAISWARLAAQGSITKYNTTLVWGALGVDSLLSDSYTSFTNNSGSTITRGQVVRAGGLLAFADDPAHLPAVGIATENVANGATGLLQISGLFVGDTSMASVGMTLFVSDTTAGGLTPTLSDPTKRGQTIGTVITVSVTGAILLNFSDLGFSPDAIDYIISKIVGATDAPDPNTFMQRDGQGSTRVLAIVQSIATTATTGSAVFLAFNAPPIQIFTGAASQDVVLPSAPSFNVGQPFYVKNRSTGTLTIKDNTGGVLKAVTAGADCLFLLLDNGSTAGVWDVQPDSGGGGSGITALTGDVTATGPGSAAATIANDAVTTVKILDAATTLAKLADIATATVIGRLTAGTGVPEVLPLTATPTLDTVMLRDSVGDTAVHGLKLANNASPATPIAGAALLWFGSTFGPGNPDTLNIQHSDGSTQVIGSSVFSFASNGSGATIPKGTPVYLDASFSLQLAKADALATLPVIAITDEAILNGTIGKVVRNGTIFGGVDTSGFAFGDILYASATVAGALTNIKPTSGFEQQLATVVVVNVDGYIEVGLGPVLPVKTPEATAATANTLVLRDGAGRASIATPVAGSDITNKVYVDTAVAAVAAGLVIKPNVDAVTTTALPANTASGGNVLTANANGAFPSVDGVTAVLNQTYLVKDEGTAVNNGLYRLTTLGDGGTPYVLTRLTELDVGAAFSGATTLAISGTQAADRFVAVTAAPDVTGTDAMTWELFAMGAINQLTGDVTAGPGTESQAATVAFVGGVSAAAVAASVSLGAAGTAAATANTLVKRDANASTAVKVLTLAHSASAPSAPASGEVALFFGADGPGPDTLAIEFASGNRYKIGQEIFGFGMNSTGSTIPKGTACYLDTTSYSLTPARADTLATEPVIAVTSQDVLNGATDGEFKSLGVISGLDTSAFVNGDILYLSSVTAGAFTNVRPVTGNKQSIAFCIHAGLSDGVILVKLGDVDPAEASAATPNTLMLRDGSGNVAVNQISGALVPTGVTEFPDKVILDPSNPFAAPPGTGGALALAVYQNSLYLQDSTNIAYRVGSDLYATLANHTGSTIPFGTLVCMRGDNMIVADASDPTKMPAFGMTLSAVNDGDSCTVKSAGFRLGLMDTSGMQQGAPLFVSATTPGAFTDVAPFASGNQRQMIGWVLTVGASASIFLAVGPVSSAESQPSNAGTLVLRDGFGGALFSDVHLDKDVFSVLGSAPSAPAVSHANLYYGPNHIGQVGIAYQDSDDHIFLLGENLFGSITNNTGSTFLAGQAVQLDPANPAQWLLAKADSLATLPALLLCYEDIPTGTTGKGMARGPILGVDTSMFPQGAILYVSAATAGALTNIRPSPYAQPVGFVPFSGVSGAIGADVSGVQIDIDPVIAKVAAYTTFATDHKTTFSNFGTAILVPITLLAAAPVGTVHEFVVEDVDGSQIIAPGSDVIYFGDAPTTAGGTLTSTSVGSCVTLKKIRANVWITTSHTGTWDIA